MTAVAFTFRTLPPRTVPPEVRAAAAATVAADPRCVAEAPAVAAMLAAFVRDPVPYVQRGTQGAMFAWAGAYATLGDLDRVAYWLARFVRLAERDARGDRDVSALLLVAADGVAFDAYPLTVRVPADPADEGGYALAPAGR